MYTKFGLENRTGDLAVHREGNIQNEPSMDCLDVNLTGYKGKLLW
jgi:hypothetical protein